MFIDFREKGRQKEKLWLVASWKLPNWGWNLQPRYVPWPGMESAHLGAWDNTPANQATQLVHIKCVFDLGYFQFITGLSGHNPIMSWRVSVHTF